MNKKYINTVSFAQRSISLTLALSLLINLTAPAAAQQRRTIPPAKRTPIQFRDRYVTPKDNLSVPAFEQRVEMEIRKQQLNKGNLTKEEDLRLQEILFILLNGAKLSQKGNSDKEIFNEQYKKQLDLLFAEHQKDLQATVAQRRKEINQIEKTAPAEMTPQDIADWKTDALAQLETWEKDSLQKLQSWKKTQLANANQSFEKGGKNILLQQREQAVKEMVADLWNISRKKSPRAKQIFLEVAPVLASLKTIQGKSFFSHEQTEWLEQAYTDTLNRSHSDTLCRQNDPACKQAFTALAGLALLGNSSKADYAISEFITFHSKTDAAAPAITNGFAALLARKAYRTLDSLLHQATLKENKIDSFDILSAGTWVNMAANINGQYLGELSKFAQYPLTEKPNETSALGNAWEDAALLLAHDNSPQALELLRKYGVETCRAYTEKNIKLQDELKGIKCHGILPFLVGALESGKSGVNAYAPRDKYDIQGDYWDAQGAIHTLTAAQAKEAQRHNAAVVKLFHSYAAMTGLTADAAIAQHLFVQSMGDLNAETELALDQKLYKVYQQSASKRAPKAKYAITPYKRGSAEYNAKAVRQERTRFFRKAAVWADIAILLWCAYDITKWGRGAFKISRGILSASKMARNGATVAQRAAMLRRLNVAPQLRKFISFPSKINMHIRTRLEPVVLAQAPLFTSVVKLPRPPGFVEAVGTTVAKGTAFSAETGILGVNVSELTASTDGLLNLQQSVQLNNALREASVTANTAFANRTTLQRFGTLRQGASYRSYLSNALLQKGALPGLTLNETFQLAAHVKSMPSVTVPANIQAFKAPQLFKNGAVQMDALQHLLIGAVGPELAAERTSQTASMLQKALEQSNIEFANRNWFARTKAALFHETGQYRNLLQDNLAAVFDADGMLFTQPNQYKIYHSLSAAVANDLSLQIPSLGTLSALRGARVKKAPKVDYKRMGTAILSSADPAVMPQEMPLNILMDTSIKGVNKTGYQRVLFTDNGTSFFFGLGNNLSEPVKLQNFKITLEAKNMPSLLRASANTTLVKPLEIKLTPYSDAGWFTRTQNWFGMRKQAFQAARDAGEKRPFKTLMRGKDNIYIHDVPVFIRQADGSLSAAPVLFKADSYLGLKGATSVLEADGSLAWYNGSRRITNLPQFSYGLPKNQLKPFLGIAKQADAPVKLFVRSGRNKLTPLMWATGLSLSSASSSLIPSLESNYGDRITETDKVLISLALPYLPSFAAPALSPIVMKLGALRTLQIALGFSTAGLAFAASQGFYGNINHDKLPSIWPLYVSGTAIGISSALSRASLNLLIDKMGGGGSLLKSMAFKNIGSFSLLVPQIIVGASGWKPDFSFAFPITGLLSAGALAWVSSARIDTNIGKVAGFMKMDPLKFNLTLPKTLAKNSRIMLKDGWRETWSSVRLLGTKELLLPTLAATAFTGFESSSFNKATNQLIRPKVQDSTFISGFEDPTDKKNWTSLLTSGTVVAFPLLTRFGAKPLLKAMSSPLNPATEYQRMLMLSYGLNIGGLSVLMANGFDGFSSPGFLGMAMIGVGTANMTQSLQKLSNIAVVRSPHVLKATQGMTAAEAAAFKKNTVTKAMTSFPVSQLGLAMLPLAVSHYTDNQIQEGIETKANAPFSSLWIPMTSIAASLGLSAPLIWKLPKLPAGTIGFGKGVFGSYSGTWNSLRHPTPQSYMGIAPTAVSGSKLTDDEAAGPTENTGSAAEGAAEPSSTETKK